MERMHVTYEQALNEPNEIVELAFLIWKLDRQREALDQQPQPQQT